MKMERMEQQFNFEYDIHAKLLYNWTKDSIGEIVL